jgi:hypothetical protein
VAIRFSPANTIPEKYHEREELIAEGLYDTLGGLIGPRIPHDDLIITVAY